MKFVRTEQFKHSYQKLPPLIQRQVDRKLILLSTNLRHPSLRAKKIQGLKDIWEARITKSYRFTFQIEGDFIILRHVGSHDKVL